MATVLKAPKRQLTFVTDLNKCIGCQTCTAACKSLWSDEKGQDRTARIGFAAIDKSYEETALVEGGNAWQIFSRVMLPLAARPLISGMILAWTRALGEFGATIMFAGNLEGVSQTMPLAIYIGFERNPDVALALSVVLIVLSASLMYLLRVMDGK